MKNFTNNAAFSVPTPAPGDRRPRNAFGVLADFGEAYAAHYRREDARKAAIGARISMPLSPHSRKSQSFNAEDAN